MKEFFKYLKMVWPYAKEAKGKIILYFILNLVAIFAGLIFPVISAQLLVKLTNNNIEQFIYTGIILVISYMITHIITNIASLVSQKIFRKVYLNVQCNLGEEILKLSNESLEENGSGVFIQRLINDPNNISSVFTNIEQYTNGIVSNLGVIITYYILSKPMFLFVLLAFTIRLVIEIVRINTLNRNKKAFKKHNDKLTGFTSEIIRGAEDIKMLNGEKSFLLELKNRFLKINQEKYEMNKTNIKYTILRMTWANISYLIMILIVGLSIKSGKMEIATGLVIYNFGNKYNSLVQNITGFYTLVKDFNLSASRIFDIYDSEKYIKEKFGNLHLDKIKGDFEFKDVTFNYKKNKVLKNLSFKVNANETVAFVGKSGAGKTTIFNLLCKMYDNYKGKITIDGIDIKELDKDSIRGNITIVSQNPYIFNLSIKENLKLVKKDLTIKEMKEACKLACLDEFIESLPEKYDTIIGEGGVNLSGGQKQRLAIARALVQKTEIILFDEATSALDNETQSKIQEAINNMKNEYTILIIAHRLSTIINANRILYLEDGKIIAEGTHKQLLKSCPEYKQLYETEIKKKGRK